MSPLPDWTALQKRLDFIVDGRWGESVILIPWAKDTGIYQPGEEGPDPARKLLTTTGIYVTPGSKVVGEMAAGGATQIVESECWLSITLGQLGGSLAYWRASDRIYLVNRDLMYSFSYAEDSATYRPNLHLIIVKDTLTGQGAPPLSLMPTQPNQLWFDLNSLRFYRADDDDNWIKIT
jgi:hypothetical protein